MSSQEKVLRDIEHDSLDDASERSIMSGDNSFDMESNNNSDARPENVRGVLINKRPAQNEKRLFHNESEDDELESQSQSLAKKQVRFNQHSDNKDEGDDSNIQPWEFRKVIRREYKEKLPNNYEIRNWRKPSKTMTSSVLQLLDNNVETALETVFVKYRPELERVTNNDLRQTGKILKQKQGIMEDIVTKIKQRLRRSKFPSRLADNDLDIEYIFAKRKYIQKRYEQELKNAERMEIELIREQEQLENDKRLCSSLKKSNTKKLTEKLVQNDLHPSLNRAMANAYGLTDSHGQDSSLTDNQIYKKDTKELNLDTDVFNESELRNINDTAVEQLPGYIPSLKRYNNASNELSKHINFFLQENNYEDIEKLITDGSPE